MAPNPYVVADRRLATLRALDEHGGRANDSVLQILLAAVGHDVARDVIRADLAWMQSVGLCTVDARSEVLHVALITEAGRDHVAGRSAIPGIKRATPRPAGIA